MSRKMNKRSFERKRRFNEDESSSSSSNLFVHHHKRRHHDADEKLDDVIKLLKKILGELKEIEDDIDDDKHHHHKDKCNHGHHHCKCHKKDDENCECDAVLIAFNSNPAQDQRFGEILAVDSSNGNFGCNLNARMGSMQGASVAEAIACLECQGFKVQSVEHLEGQRTLVLLTRKKCDQKCDD